MSDGEVRQDFVTSLTVDNVTGQYSYAHVRHVCIRVCCVCALASDVHVSRVYTLCACVVCVSCVYVCLVCVCARCLHPAGAINLQFRVENKGWESFDFTCALHTYFAVDDIDSCSLEGLGGARQASRRCYCYCVAALHEPSPCRLAVVLRPMQDP